MNNEELLALFVCDCNNEKCESPPINPLLDQIENLLKTELPKYINLEELDDVQWKYLYNILFLEPFYNIMSIQKHKRLQNRD